jgi:hypothetical protein
LANETPKRYSAYNFQYSQGKQKRFLDFTQVNINPGPGNYFIKKPLQNNIGSFSRASRLPKNPHELFPGPADYAVKIPELHPVQNVSFVRAERPGEEKDGNLGN